MARSRGFRKTFQKHLDPSDLHEPFETTAGSA